MKVVLDFLVLVAVITIVALAYWWDDIHIPQFIPDRAEELYKEAPLNLTTVEHIRVIRNGRYITVCYWVTINKTQATQVNSCTTQKEYFNGY